MTAQYRTFFGLSREPFRSDLSLKEILKTPALSAVSGSFRIHRPPGRHRPGHRRYRVRKIHRFTLCGRQSSSFGI